MKLLFHQLNNTVHKMLIKLEEDETVTHVTQLNFQYSTLYISNYIDTYVHPQSR